MEADDQGPQQLHEAMLDAMQDVVVIISRDGRNRYANSAMERTLGYPPEEMVGSSTIARVHVDDRAQVVEAFVSINDRPGASVSMHYRSLHRDGRWIPCVAKATNLCDDPTVAGFVVTSRDITEELAATERFRQIADNASDVIYRLRLDTLSFDYINRAVIQFTGWTPEEIQADPLGAIGRIIHPDDLPLIDRYLRQDFTAPHLDMVELRWMNRDGRWTWAEHRFTIVRGPDGDPMVIDGIARDISSLKAIEKELSILAQQDELTGLPNRRALLHIIERRLETEGSAGVLFLDLDGFKQVNDTLGHDAGDQLLIAVAGRLSASVRGDDVVVRFAGDEFVILTDPTALTWLASRLLEGMTAPFALTAGNAIVSASIGTAVGLAGEDPTSLLRRADQAMYDAKHSGKGRISHS